MNRINFVLQTLQQETFHFKTTYMQNHCW